jgi:dihydroorotate dehydrogenase
LNAEEYGKPLIFSGSPTNDPENKYGNSADQAARLAYELLSTCVDMVEINVSCPNVVTEGGGRKPIMGYDLESLEEMQAAIKHMVGTGQALGIKMPPYITPEEKSLIPDIAELIRSENVFKYLVTANTIPNQIPVDVNRSAILSVPGGKGGMSGPSTKPQGREQLALWHTALGDSIDIVSTLGVDSGQELAMRRRLGAVAAGGVTFLWESNNWGIAVEQVLQDYAKAGAP